MRIPASMQRSATGNVRRAVLRLLQADQSLSEWCEGSFYRGLVALPVLNGGSHQIVVAPGQESKVFKPSTRLEIETTTEILLCYEESREYLSDADGDLGDVVATIERIIRNDYTLAKINGGEKLVDRLVRFDTIDFAYRSDGDDIQGAITLGVTHRVDVNSTTWEKE